MTNETNEMTNEIKQTGWAYWEGDKLIVRASAAWKCMSGIVAAALGEPGFPPGSFVRSAMDVSSELEDVAIAEYRKRTGHPVIWQQKTLELDLGTVVIRGHIDGMDQPDDDLLEVKWLSGRNFDLYNRGGLDALGNLGLSYKGQAAIYGHSVKRDIRFVIGNKEGSPNDPDNEWLIIEPPVTAESLVPLAEIEERMAQVLDCALNDVIPDCDRGCSKNEAYAHVHIFPAVNMGGAELEEKLARIAALDKVIKALTGDDKHQVIEEAISITIPPGPTLSALKDAVKQECGTGTHIAGRYKAIISPMGGVNLATKEFKKRYPEIYDEFAVPRSGSKIIVTQVGNGEE